MIRRDFLTALAAFGSSAALPVMAVAGTAGPMLPRLWADFRSRFVMADGSVPDTGNRNIVHTEALGVALLFAQESNDRTTFERIEAFRQRLVRPDGLHAWRWESDKGVTDANNATDGDIYIAWAHARAAERWGRAGSSEQARRIALALEKHCVATIAGRPYLIPGVQGFTRVDPATGKQALVANPSYWVFPALRELRAVGSPLLWKSLHDSARRLLQDSPGASSGLAADWLLMEDPVVPWPERPARFGFEAVRVPLFLAWEGFDSERVVLAAARHMQSGRFPAWVALEGGQEAEFEAPEGFKAVASVLRRAVYGAPLEWPALTGDYYSSSLVLLSVMAATARGWVV